MNQRASVSELFTLAELERCQVIDRWPSDYLAFKAQLAIDICTAFIIPSATWNCKCALIVPSIDGV